MKSLAIIPARGGSKRLPQKNIRLLGNIPLVEHTLSAAQESGCFESIILSSDDKKILSVANNYSKVEIWQRPESLSGDHVTALELVCDITSKNEIKNKFDVVSLLLPTCPFRNANHIKEGFSLLTNEIDGVVSLTTYEFPPQLSIELNNDIVEPVFNPCPLITGNTRSQDQKTIYRPNGGFYIQWMKKFEINQNFFKGKVKGYIMNRINSVDIDTEEDLEYANFLINKKNGKI